MSYYRVDLVAGPYSWTVEKDDPPGYGPTDGLRFGWEIPEGDLIYHPDHASASFGLVVEDPDDVAELDTDSPVAIRVYTRENLLPNGDFETPLNLTGWAAQANCTISNGTVGFSGAKCLNMTATAAGQMAARTTVPGTPGKWYSAQARFRAFTTARTVLVRVNFLNAAGATIQQVLSPSVADTTTGWTPATTPPTVAPAGTVNVRVDSYVSGAAAGELHRVDAVTLQQTTRPAEWPTPETCDWSFYGRVTDLNARPHALGMVYQLTAMSYTADLADANAGLTAWPEWSSGDISDFTLARVEAIVEEAGYTIDTAQWVFPLATVWATGREADAQPAWGLLLQTLQQTATLNHRFIIRPYATDAGPGRASDGVQFATAAIPRELEDTFGATPELPANLTQLAGVWSVTLIPGAEGVVDASWIETQSVVWRRANDDTAQRIRLKYQHDTTGMGDYVPRTLTVQRSGQEQGRTLDLDWNVSDGTSENGIQLLAASLLPDPARYAWQADSFRYRLSDAPDGLPSLMLNAADPSAGGSAVGWLYAQPLAIDEIPAAHNPTPRPWVAGQVVAADLTVADGVVYVEFKLSRTVPGPRADEFAADHIGLSYADMALAPYAGITPAQLNPTDTYYDYRLVRRL